MGFVDLQEILQSWLKVAATHAGLVDFGESWQRELRQATFVEDALKDAQLGRELGWSGSQRNTRAG